MAPTLGRLVIKPTLACTARCPTCALRTKLFNQRHGDPVLSLTQWGDLMRDARRLGGNELHISGGEPSLDPRLEELVGMGRRLGMTTNVNTNGGAVTEALAKRLADVGLDSATISLYSHRAATHDALRCQPGLFDQALRSLRWLQHHGVAVDLQTTLVRGNLLDLAEFLEMSYRLEVGYLYVSYLEGDRKKRWLPTAEQIRRFREEVIPRSTEIIMHCAPAQWRDEALRAVATAFAGDEQRVEEFSQGEYHPVGRCECARPYDFTLVLANGDVLPCNGVEYCHSPIMGNVFATPLPDLWHSESWDQFRRARHAWCRWCPVTLHFRIPILGCRAPSRSKPAKERGVNREEGRLGIT